MVVSCNYSEDPFIGSTYIAVSVLSAVVGFVSLLASCCTIVFILLLRQFKFFNQRLVLYLALSAAIFSLAAIVQRVDYRQETGADYTHFCIFSGFLNQLSSWMILDAVTSITVSLITRAFFNRNPESFERFFVLFIFAFPFTFNWIPFIKMAYGKSGPWCWIRSLDENGNEGTLEEFQFGLILQLLLWYIPLYIIILVQIVLFVLVTVKLLRFKKYSTLEGYMPYRENDSQEVIKETVPLLAYPVIYFIVNIFPLVNRIQAFFQPCSPSPALWLISGFFIPLIGVLIVPAYLLDPQNRKKLNRANFKVALNNLYMQRQFSAYDYSIPDENLTDSLRPDQMNGHKQIHIHNERTAHVKKTLNTKGTESSRTL